MEEITQDTLEVAVDVTETNNYFDQQIAEVTDSLFQWGFTNRKEEHFNTRDDFNKHWWLKTFTTISPEYEAYYPKLTEYANIIQIRQFSFTKGWKFVIEEWTLKDRKAALKWLDIAMNTRDIDNFKPPRVYWTDTNRLYFIMATASVDWSEHGEQLIEIFTGKKRQLIELLNDPLDLQGYKNIKGGSNTSTSGSKPYFDNPDTTGFNLSYFLFRIEGYREAEAFRGLIITTYKYGNDIGYYTDTNEKLIAVRSMLVDPHLGQLNLVGKDRSFLKNKFGISSPANLILENQNGYMLILHLANESVDWFHYLRSNLVIDDISELPDELKVW